MADKNKNGIDDRYEKFKPGQRVSGAPGIPSTRAKEIPETNWLSAMLTRPVRQGLNFIGDTALAFSGQGGRSTQDRFGTGLGDTIFGVTPGYYDERNRAVAAAAGKKPASAPQRVAQPGAGGAEVTRQPSLLDFLSDAGSIVDQLGIGGDTISGGGPAVDYSPAMANARATADRNRGHISGIYDQLRSGLESDRVGIAQNFGDAIDRSQEITQGAQNATRAAYDAAQQRQDQAAEALGMQAAAASQQLDRPTTQQMAADAIGDQAAMGQNAQTMYNSQQANATQHNMNVQGASRFGEARAQSDLDASLADRLDELGRLQAEANFAAQAQRQSGGGERGSAILSLAQSLYGDALGQGQQDFENELAVSKLLGNQQAAAPQFTLEQLMQGQAESGLNTQDYLSFMKLLSSMNG